MTSAADRRGFTIIELLVVIAVIGLLVGLVAVVGPTVLGQQRGKLTEARMNNIMLALEQFTIEDPLGRAYNKKTGATFGALPPYQLANASNTGAGARNVVLNFEPDVDPQMREADELDHRLARDLGGDLTSPGDRVSIDAEDTLNQDNRALYAYMKVFGKGLLQNVDPGAIQPLARKSWLASHPQGEWVSRTDTSTGDNNFSSVAQPVLGFVDGWGVPFDYFVAAKVDWAVRPNPSGSGNSAGVKIVDRRPMLRSRGIDRELYDQTIVNAAAADRFSDPSKWIFSGGESLPKPWADVNDEGVLNGSEARFGGWVRMVAAGDEYKDAADRDGYGYIPSQDRAIAQ
ncbi:MAG: type II secretion system protein [Phycisphaerales bacterium]|nr:type II secretion system protein [Phycisphaerales bacterium]